MRTLHAILEPLRFFIIPSLVPPTDILLVKKFYKLKLFVPLVKDAYITFLISPQFHVIRWLPLHQRHFSDSISATVKSFVVTEHLLYRIVSLKF